ncbi:MAG: GerAB/ArcD/ProY family transporter [Roseburia sp.]|nr:GerAB/ArcD/ProY family transporter [Roseburia sp.]
MFVKNNQISGRQAMRLITFDLLGYSALLVPSALAELTGRDGIFSILLGVAAGVLFLGLLKAATRGMSGSYGQYLVDTFGTFVGNLIKAGYAVYFFLLAGRVASVFAELVVSELLEQQFRLILLMILALVYYGVAGGIEGRARVYEILFWILLLPLLVMMLCALPTVDMDYWMPVFETDLTSFLKGSYLVFLCIPVLCLLPFLMEYVSDGEQVYSCGKKALFLTGGILATLYLILLGMFGADALAQLDYPVVTMMSRVQITGGFMKRADALMFGIWFFTLYALLSSLAFVGGNCLPQKVNGKWGRLLQVVGIFVLADCFYHSDMLKNYYEKFFAYVGTPYVILIPVLAYLVKKGKRTMAGSLMLLCCLLFSGCANTQVEDREFPVLLTVSSEADFNETWFNSLQEGTKKIDYNHLKVLLLERDFLEDEAAIAKMLSVLKEDKNVPLNTYVVTTDDLSDIVKSGENLDVPLGNYLEELLENADGIKKEAYPTLGMLYQEAANRMETLFIPYLSLMDEKPAVTAYEVYKRGSAQMPVETDAALLSFFVTNQLKEYTLQLGVNNYVKLSNAKNEISFAVGREESGLMKKQVVVQIKCDGKVLYQMYDEEKETAEEWLETQVAQYMTIKASNLLEQGIDITNGLKKLGGGMREWYAYYADAPDFYEEDIEIIFRTDIRWID